MLTILSILQRWLPNNCSWSIQKKKTLDADARAIQQTEFYEMLNTNWQVCTVLEKSKETVLEFYNRKAKVL